MMQTMRLMGLIKSSVSLFPAERLRHIRHGGCHASSEAMLWSAWLMTTIACCMSAEE